jgi:hypothetical protein
VTAKDCAQIVTAMGADGGWDQWQEFEGHGDDQRSLKARWSGGDPLTAARVLVGKLGLEVQATDLGHGVVRFS